MGIVSNTPAPEARRQVRNLKRHNVTRLQGYRPGKFPTIEHKVALIFVVDVVFNSLYGCNILS